MSKPLTYSLIILFVVIFANSAFANNLSISNARVTDWDSTAGTALVEFDISWNNSWRDSTNYDAVWVFCKISQLVFGDPNSVGTSHLTLKTAGTNPSGYSQGSGTAVDLIVPSDKKGVFIQRSSAGSGTVTVTNVQLVWDIGGDNLDLIPGDTLVTGVNVYGIEMVYIPQGGFHAGDGGTGSQAEFEYGSSSSLPAPINSEEGMSFSNTSGGGWYYNSGGNTGENGSGTVFNVASSFPKGYQAFYIMKYEISAGQYVAFLNTLSRNQQGNRVASAISGNVVANYFVMSNTTGVSTRNRITCPSTGNGTLASISFSATSSLRAGLDNRAANYLSWMDLAAYADWAALRPLTEFEFEKAARGPIYPVPSEYAWGTTSITAAATIAGTENGTETISTANANSVYGNPTYTGGDGSQGPLRSGIFATSATVTRQTSGGGYYGVMELSGNVSELYVSIGNSSGLGFSGTHGDGTLTNISGATYDGNATNLDWPGIDASDQSRGITAATGAGIRGGAYSSVLATPLEVSDRTNAVYSAANARNAQYSGRLGRTA